MLRPLATSLLACALWSSVASADPAKDLADKGIKLVQTKDVITGVEWPDASKATDADYRLIAQIPHLKTLNFGKGLSDSGLAIIAGMPEVESIQMNAPAITDDGLKSLAKLTTLKTLAMFHPGKSFTGTGLAALAELPNFQRLTVAGSNEFADDGLAAVAKLTRLQEFRSWHAGTTLDGLQKLKSLQTLKSLNLGQRLAYKPPASISDATIPLLLDLKALESVQLGEARISLAALSRLKDLPNLKKLTLDGIDLPEPDLAKLKAELPKVDVKWTKPSEAYLKRINALNPAA